MIMIVVVLTFLPGCAQQNGDSPADEHDKPEETFTDSADITETADALETTAQLTREETKEKVDGAALDIGYIAAKDTFAEADFGRRGPPVDAVTHLMLDGSMVKVEDLLIMRQLESELPYLADILDDTNIKWYHNGAL